MRKLYIVAGAAVGYVLGTRAGRERYDQLMDQASRVWGDPRVQEKVEEVKEKAPGVASQVGDKAKNASSSVKGKVSGDDGDSDGEDTSFSNATGAYDTQSGPQVDTSGFGPGGERLP